VYQKEYYNSNKYEYLQKNRKRRLSIRMLVNSLKANKKCLLCPESHPACLDFHHEDRKSKLFNISNGKDRSVESILKEVEKCILICSNCHRKKHHEAGVP
jgi:hypothetical protein